MQLEGPEAMQRHILLVEDDAAIAEMIAGHLRKEGYALTHAADGAAALRLFRTQPWDLLVLDLLLPELDGLALLQQIRQTSFVPVLIVSARDGELDKALGLGFGADDYLAKPFSLIELAARVRAGLRRATEYAQPRPQKLALLRAGELELDRAQLRVSKRGVEIKLTAKELGILQLLMEQPRRAFSKAQIYELVWNDAYWGAENVIQVHISRLREKIEDDPAAPRYVKTVWGIGYKLGEV